MYVICLLVLDLVHPGRRVLEKTAGREMPPHITFLLPSICIPGTFSADPIIALPSCDWRRGWVCRFNLRGGETRNRDAGLIESTAYHDDIGTLGNRGR
jgi:hypothetical protein